MRRAPCRPHGLWVWDQRDLQCLSLPDGGSWRLRGSQTHIDPRLRGECLLRTQQRAVLTSQGKAERLGDLSPGCFSGLRSWVGALVPPPPLPPRVSCGPAIRGASWAAAAGACTPLDLDLHL